MSMATIPELFSWWMESTFCGGSYTDEYKPDWPFSRIQTRQYQQMADSLGKTVVSSDNTIFAIRK
jgi:hypothetical protein